MPWKNDQVSDRETEYIIKTAQKCLSIPGDYTEFGCYGGDTSLQLAEIIKNTDKTLWLYDSFEGLPEKSPQDMSALGEDFDRGELKVTKREVKERFLRAGLKLPIIKKAWFSDLTPDDLPTKIALAFLDGDFYDSIRASLELVTPRMADRGVIIIHDYNNPALPGVRKAVDEWLWQRKSHQNPQNRQNLQNQHPSQHTPENKISTLHLQVLETCAIIGVASSK